MSNTLDHQTSAFMNANGGSFTDVTQPDAVSGGRLLSTSGDDKRPRIRMTKPARRRVWLMLAIVLIVVILIAIVIIIAVTASSSDGTQSNSEDSTSRYEAHKVPHFHVRCLNDVIVAENDSHAHWQHYGSKAHHWKKIPNVNDAGYVLISPRYKLEAGYPGVMVSMLLPRNNTRIHLMAVENKDHHSYPVSMASSNNHCESAILDDPSFFDGNETEFRIYVFYRSHMPLDGIKFTVTSLPLTVSFESMTIKEKVTTHPDFVRIQQGQRDVCSVEIVERERHCNWWNANDGDNANFDPTESSSEGCIDGGLRSHDGAVWFLALESHDTHHESRALYVSPVITRKTGSVLLTLWYMFKCEGPHLRIHRIPAERSSFRHAFASSSVVADVTTPASHSDWKFLSFQIPLPKGNDAYHIVLEGIVPRNGNCTQFRCSSDGLHHGEQPTSPILGLDSLTLELMHEQCESTNKSNLMDCKFQTKSGEPTMCEWESSLPLGVNKEAIAAFPSYLDFQDWKAINSGDDDDHGATSQHFEGRGYIMSFDASGRVNSESHVRTPLLIAKQNCSCVMSFYYLMRGLLTPRMQVNVIYGADIKDDNRISEPQWSLLGNQGEDWKIAAIVLNLKTGRPFQIEIRVLDIYVSRGDVHFDDLFFSGCDMDKYVES